MSTNVSYNGITFPDGTFQDTAYASSGLVTVGNITYISKSGYNSIGILMDGKLYTTSGNFSAYAAVHSTGRGLDGHSAGVGLNNFSEVIFPNEIGPILQANISQSVSYALFGNGNLYTWGENSNGQCGLGHTNPVGVPTLATNQVAKVFSHPTNSSYSTADSRLFIQYTYGTVAGCGYNSYGAVGIGNTTASITSFAPLTVSGLVVTNPISVWNMGSTYGCVVIQLASGAIYVAGYNGQGQLGLGDTTVRTSLTIAPNWRSTVTGGTITKVIGGFGYYTTGASAEGWMGMLIDNGGTYNDVMLSGTDTWGSVGNGGTGTGTVLSPASIRASMGANKTWADIAGYGGGPGTVMAVTTAGQLYSWGYNAYGQVGDGTKIEVPTPTLRVGITASKLFSDGFDMHTYGHYVTSFVLSTSNKLYSCGNNDNGQAGSNTPSGTDVTTLSQVRLPANDPVKLMGSFATTNNGFIYVAITTSNRIYAWGYNGQYGIMHAGGDAQINVPTNIPHPLGI